MLWYHNVPQTPPKILEKSNPKQRRDRGSKIRLFSTNEWIKFSKKRQNASFYHYLVWNSSLWLLVLYYLHQIFIIYLSCILKVGNFCQRPIRWYRLLPVVFTKFVCMTNPVDHGWWLMILCWKFLNNEV